MESHNKKIYAAYKAYTASASRSDLDELQHWKYIKRERKNGKWVYTYPNDKLGIKNFIDTKVTGKAYEQHLDEVTKKKIAVDNSANSNRDAQTRAKLDLLDAKLDYSDQLKKADAEKAAGTKIQSTVKNAPDREAITKAENKLNELQLKGKSLENQSKSLKEEQLDVRYDYYNKSLKGISEATIERGKKKVASILRKLANRLG